MPHAPWTGLPSVVHMEDDLGFQPQGCVNMISKAAAILVLSSFLGLSNARPQSVNACASVTAEYQAGLWLFVGGCNGANCDTATPPEKCGEYGGGSTTRKYCGCDDPNSSNSLEPTCCHIVLERSGGGPWLPKAEGKCSAQEPGCPAGNTCQMLGGQPGDTTAARNCKHVTPPPPPH
jgi:hypothetical protein